MCNTESQAIYLQCMMPDWNPGSGKRHCTESNAGTGKHQSGRSASNSAAGTNADAYVQWGLKLRA